MRAILALPDEDGCGHYRCRFPGEAVRQAGVDVGYARTAADISAHPKPLTIRERQNPEYPKDPRWFTGLENVEVIGIAEILADVVIMQRPLRRIIVETIPLIQKQGVAVVVDMDDDFSCLDPKHMGYKRAQPDQNPESNWRHVAEACKLADLVTVTTPALAKRYGAHGRVRVLPNYVPEKYLGVESPWRDDRTVGWAGYVGTHPQDLLATGGGVQKALVDTGSRFLNVGTGDRVKEGLGLDDEQVEFFTTGVVPIADFPKEIARFTVGLVPLADTKFNQAKSALKGLEYASVGVPFVASPTEDYQRIADDGIGVLAPPRGRNWTQQIKAMLGPEGEEKAAAAKQRIGEAYLYEQHAHEWAEAWQDAIAIRLLGKPRSKIIAA